MVDDLLGWLRRERPARFVSWLFNFDLHNWRELDKAYIDHAAARYGVPSDGAWNWQYRVVARTIDAELERLLQGLDELGLRERTIVVFVADHGECLGYQGFWGHSVFLWESLVRVPLVLRIPGVAPRSIQEPVSLVDVAPTLARFLEPDAVDESQGEDLLVHLVTENHRRRLPLLLTSSSEGQTASLGIVEGRRKLILPLDWGEPQLLDLDASTPDEAEVSSAEPSRTLDLMNALVRSPMFARDPVTEPRRAAR
jgi:hypothetical protein